MKITIPNPCSEDWQTMTATEKGRFCAVCQKCVVDFTTMTDVEIVHYLNNQKGKTCGRFSKEQLNRPLTPSNWFTIPLSKWVLASTFSLSFMSPKEGFAAVPMVQTQKVLVDFQKEKFLQSIDNEIFTDSLVIKGIVLDSVNRETLVGAIIEIRGTSIGTLTDADGNFALNIPIEYQNYYISLTISNAGYKGYQMTVKKENAHEKLEIKMESIKVEVELIGKLGAVYYKPTLWQRTKRLFRKKYH